MQKYRDIVLDNTGNAILSSTVTITDNPGGGVSTIYSDDGVTALANPLTASGVDGVYEFYAANGRYDITIAATGFDTEQITDIILNDHADDISSVEITGGTIDGTVIGGTTRAAGAFTTLALDTDLPVTEGGTGSSTASDARTALGVAIGTDVQAYDAQLDDVAGLTPTDGNIIVGDGSNFVAESGATARTSLGAAASGANSDITSITGLTTDLTVAQGGTGAGTFTDAGVLVGNGTGIIQVTSAGTASQVLTSNGAGVDPTFQAVAGGVTLATPQASTSGTSIDFTSIPASTKMIVIMFEGVSTSGTSVPMVQLGDSGGFETSNYLGSVSISSTFVNYSSGFYLATAWTAARTTNGTITFRLLDSTNHIWTASGGFGLSNEAGTYLTAGTKTLSAELTQVRITTIGGSDTFDAGSINIQYL